MATSGTPASAVTVTPSDGGAGGAFSPSTVSLSGANPSATFTYTPASVGTATISTTNTGGLTNPAALSYAASVSAVTIPATGGAFRFSPGGWSCLGARACPSGFTAPSSLYVGSWFSVTWTAGASPTATLLLPTTSTTMKLGCYLNGAYTLTAAAGNITLTASKLLASATNTLKCWIASKTNNGASWNGGVNHVTVQALQVDGASSAGVAPAAKPWILHYGDSISVGLFSDAAVSSTGNYINAFPFQAGQALDAQGYDLANDAFTGSDFVVTGEGGIDPALYAITGASTFTNGTYSDSTSRWNKVDTGVSRLDANGRLSAYGGTGQEPAAIVFDLGGNAASLGTSPANQQASIYQAIRAMRAAAPSATIVFHLEWGLATFSAANPNTTYRTYAGYYAAAVAQYRADYPADTKVLFVDDGPAIGGVLYGNLGTYAYTDSQHLLVAGNAYVAPSWYKDVVGAIGGAAATVPAGFPRTLPPRLPLTKPCPATFSSWRPPAA